ncbi:glycosyltransferase [Akkermansiaceae bacterium]|nr:glycosyltransferase [Akkermansiaceae bacterium]
MRILVNCSTLSATGVTQVATSFIHECLEFPENSYDILLSKTLSKEINTELFPDNFAFHLIKNHPLYGFSGFSTRSRIKKLERQIKPDIVFSVFGPSWWTPKAPHLMGFAYPYIVYPESPYFSRINQFEKIKTKLKKLIHVTFLKRNANYFVSETDNVAVRISDILGIPKENSFVATNTCSSLFYEEIKEETKILESQKQNEFRFLSLCSLSAHKNLEILNKLVPLIKGLNSDLQIKFILTVDPDLFEKSFSDLAKKSIINLGRIEVSKCPQIYRECDALFLPTLLECSTANYPEAMKMGKPIITSDLAFATEVCGDAALYFNPLDPPAILRIIKLITESKSIRSSLVRRGKKRLDHFLTASERAEKYLEICEEIINKETDS